MHLVCNVCGVCNVCNYLGFQGSDPLTDLRAAGVTGLRHLLNYLQDGERGARRLHPSSAISSAILSTISSDQPPPLVDPDDAAAFPLALASINCTALLHGHLSLYTSVNVFGSHATTGRSNAASNAAGRATLDAPAAGAPAPEMQRLLRLAAANRQVLPELHARWLAHLEALWGERRTATSTIMDFTPVLHEAFEHMTAALRDTELEAIDGRGAQSAGWHHPHDAPSQSPDLWYARFADHLASQIVSQVHEPQVTAADVLPAPTPEEHRLMAMGFEFEAVREALEHSRGDLQAAVSLILA